MAKPERVIELLVPDVHNEWAIYECLERVLENEKANGRKVKRVFHLGDLRQDDVRSKGIEGAIYEKRLKEFAQNIDPQVFNRFEAARAKVLARDKQPRAQEFYDALDAGKPQATAIDQQLATSFMRPMKD